MKSIELVDYILETALAKGIMGTLYLARPRNTTVDKENSEDSKVVIKILNKEYCLNAAYRKLFVTEVEKYRLVDIPNMVEILDVIVTEDLLGVVMPVYKGQLLLETVPSAGLSITEALNIAKPLGEAIDQMHEAGVLHGNLTPADIMIEDGKETPMLLGVGIYKNAFWLGCIQSSPYRSPEEMKDRQINTSSDRYAFAMVVYQMLTGRLPWGKSEKPREVMTLKEQDRLAPISVYCPSVSVSLLIEMMGMLSSDIEERPLNCQSIIQGLEDSLFEEKNNSYPEMDPEKLKQLKMRVLAIDNTMASIETKIKRKEGGIKEIQRKYSLVVNEKKQWFSRLEGEWSKKFSVVKKDIFRMKQESAPSLWSKHLPTLMGTKEKNKKNAKKLEAAKKSYKKLKVTGKAEIVEAKEKIDTLLDKALKNVEKKEEPLRESLISLYKEKKNLEEELIEYENLHPRLLGFRAKKYFSKATVSVGNVTLEMILIPEGKFSMGAYSGTPDVMILEKPLHDVVLTSSFWVSETVVTQSLFKSIVGRNPSYFKGEERPVEMVTWYDAIQFCNALSIREGLQPCYEINSQYREKVHWKRPSNGYRLLTEAEWEYIAKAESSALFAGGNIAKRLAWFDKNSGDETHPVKGKAPNRWGFYDLNGNVWEWCWDWFGAYPDSRETDPIGTSEGKGRIFRGGSFRVEVGHMRLSYRAGELPHKKMDGVGFRLARDKD